MMKARSIRRPMRPSLLELLLLVFIAASVTAAGTHQTEQTPLDDATDPVALAISKCRSRLRDVPLNDVPHAFPKTQYRLALLLESQLTPRMAAAQDEEWAGAVVEIASLYEASAYNETHGFPPSVRVEALTKAASLVLEAGDHIDDSRIRAEKMLRTALEIRGENVDEDPQLLRTAYAVAFETLSNLLLSRASEASANKVNGGDESERLHLESALELCDTCAQLAPKEPVCDEFRGAALRRLYRTRGAGRDFAKSSILSGAGSDKTQSPASVAKDVHSAYESAAKKSHEAAIVAMLNPEALSMSRYPCGTLKHKYGRKLPPSTQLKQVDPANNDVTLLSELWTRLVRHIVLAAAAAREAGLRDEEDFHVSYGLAIMSHLTLSELVSKDAQADFLTNAGIRHKVRGETKEAARYFRAAVEANPGDGHALVQLASLGDRQAASIASLSDTYVAGLFDGYSDRFEKELLDELGYRGHEIVADAIDRHWGGPTGTAEGDVVLLDIGCGTGLLGSLLREKIGAIIAGSGANTCKSSPEPMQKIVIQGVDLSERMVTISRKRMTELDSGTGVPVYDTVQKSDALKFLQALESTSIHIITASDVLIYVGAVDEIFRECSRVLKAGGLMGFTVEIPPGRTGAKGLLLLKSGRFGHSKAYVEEAARKAGLIMVEWKEEVLRKQGKEDVIGAVVTLRLA